MPYVTAIYAEFVETSRATFEITAPDEAEMRKRRQVVLDRGLPYLVAELEGYFAMPRNSVSVKVIGYG